MENETDIGSLIVLTWTGASLLILLVSIICFYGVNKIINSEKRRQVAAIKLVFEAEENLRRKIAANLHDEVIPQLSVLSRLLDKESVQRNDNDFSGNQKAQVLTDQVIETIKAISHDLVPPLILNFGLIKAIQHYILQLNDKEHSVEMENKTGLENNLPISINDQLNIYRLCLEVLQNLTKHARYKYLRLDLMFSKETLTFQITHNGIGVTTEEMNVKTKDSKGQGLKSIQTRLMILKGQIRYFQEQNKSVVIISIPLRHEP